MTALLHAIPHIAGGAMISSAIALSSRLGKTSTDSSTSVYSFLGLDSQSKWKSSFIAGMLFAASLVASLYGFEEVGETSIKPFESEKLFFKGTGIIQFMLSGLLIGLGSRLAQRGLSNFSFNGIPRFSGPSLVATAVAFMFAAATATLRSNFHFLQGINVTKKFNEHLDFRLSFLIPLLILGFNLLRNYSDVSSVKDIMKQFGLGNLLAAGMMAAGLGRRHQVLDFLSLNKHWNPFFAFVLLGAFLANTFLWNVAFPNRAETESLPAGSVSPRMLLGCSLFGIGLGISGLTPGSGLLVSPIYLPQVALFFLPFIVAGQMGVGFLDKMLGFGGKTAKVQ
jgi:hypothetical protein